MRFQRPTNPSLASRLFAGREATLALLRAAWPHAVGAEVARRTDVLGLEGSTLRVRVPDGRWRKVLHRMQPEILARLAEVAGALAPRRLGFNEGSVPGATSSPSPDPGDPAGPGATPPARIAEQAALITDPELRERFLKTAASYLQRSRRR